MALDPAIFDTVDDPLLDQTETEVFNGDFRRKSVRAAALDSATQLLVPDPSFRQMPKPKAGFFDGVGEGFSQAGIAVGLAEFGSRALGSKPMPADPTYNLASDLEAAPDRMAIVNEIVQAANQGDAAGLALYNALGNGVNQGVTNEILQQWQNIKDSRRVIEEAGLFPFITGMVGGIGIDVLLAALANRGLGAPAAVRSGTVGMARILSAESQMSARLLAANRIARYGAIEGGIEAGVQGLTDPSVTDSDVLIAAGLGGIGGAALGFAFPKFIGRVFTPEQIAANERRLDTLAKAQNAHDAGDSVGAARVEGDEFAATVRSGLPVVKGGGTVIGKRLPDFSRSPKQTLADMNVAGRRLLEEDGLSGTSQFARFFQRVYKSARLNEDELGGAQTGRDTAFSEQLNQLNAELVVHSRASQALYLDMAKDVFDIGKFRATVGNNQAFEFNLTEATGGAIRGGAPSSEEFNHVADLYGIARGQGFLEGNEEEILKALGRDFTPEQKTKLLAHIEKQATHDDKYWDKVFDEAVKVGVVKEEDRIAGYRPQNWNQNEILQHQTLFKNALYDIFGGEVDTDWVNKRWAKTADDGTVIEGEDLIPEGMDFSTWSKDNPALAGVIADEWESGLKQVRDEQLTAAVEQVRQELKDLGAKTIAEVTRARRQKMQKIDKSLRNYEQKLRELEESGFQDKAQIEELQRLMAKKELQRETMQGRLRKLDDAVEEEQRLRNALRGAGKAARKDMKAANKKLKGAIKKANSNTARKTLTETVDEVFKKITSGESAFGYIPDDLTSTSKHFKFRTINLGANILRQDIRRFLIKDSEHVRRVYQDTFGRQTALRKNFGPLLGLRPEDNIKDIDFLQDLKTYAMKGFSDDDLRIERGGVSAKAAQASKVNRQRASELFDRAFGEITRSDYINQSGGADNVMRSAQAFTAASALGMVFLSLIADTAMMTMAGGRTGTGWKAFFRSRQAGKILDTIQRSDLDMGLLLRGENVQDQGVFMARADLDTPTFDVPGSKWRAIARTTQNVAQLSGWANLMHVWNRWVRRSFGLDFARQIGVDLGEWDTLSDNMKEFYTRHGVGAREAKALGEALADNRISREVSGVRIPISQKWNERDWKLYQRLVRGAGDEALIDPQIGDRPFFRRHAMGRLILQFQSFMYTAGERWFAPMIQTGRLHPEQVRVYASALLALGLSMAANGARAYRRDEGDKWQKQFSTHQGRFDIMKEAWLRSPFVFGMTGLAADFVGTQFAPMGNAAFSGATGSDFKLFNERHVRLRQQQGMLALFGAAPGVVGSTFAMGRELAEGDFDRAAEMAQHRVPIVNTLPVQGITKLINELGD